jgi:membrane associated rhomboid family serine protease
VQRHEPMFNVPGVVLAVIAALIGVQVARYIMPGEWSAWLTIALAFIPARYSQFPEAIPGGDVASVTSFLTYALVHADVVHLAINSVWLLAFGGAIANRVGAKRFLLFSAVCAIVGAVGFLAFNIGLPVPMVGASGAVSGMMGGTMRFLFGTIGSGGGLRALRENPRAVQLIPLHQAMLDRRVLAVTGAFLLANTLAVFGLGGVSAGGIAWEAHLGGYFAGLFLFGLFEPPPTVVHQSA